MDYNKKDEQYVSYVFGKESGYGVLRPAAQKFLIDFRRLVAERLKANAADPLAKDLSKLLSRAETVLFYSSKIAERLGGVERLPEVTPEVAARVPASDLTPPAMMISPQRELGMEFESLVLHALAGLDTLANVISDHCVDSKRYNNKGKEIQAYFSELKIALQQSQQSDIRSEYLFGMMCECENLLQDIVLPANGRKTLRNHIAHEATTADLIDSNFVVHWLPDGRVLRLDCEVYGMPLVETARSLTWTTAYMLLRSVGIFLGRTANGAVLLGEWAWKCGRPGFEPAWHHTLVSWKEYLSDDPNHPFLSVAWTNEAAFGIDNMHLKPEILDRATPFGISLRQPANLP